MDNLTAGARIVWGTKPITKKNTRKGCYSNPGNKYGAIMLRKKECKGGSSNSIETIEWIRVGNHWHMGYEREVNQE